MPASDEAFPPAPRYNFTSHWAVDLPSVDLADAYARLGRCESLRSVIGLSPVAQNIDISPVETLEGENGGHVDQLNNMYNLPAAPAEASKAAFRRAKFSFREHMTYAGFINVDVDLIGSHVEPVSPALDAAPGPVVVLYESYGKQQGVWVRKRRAFTRLPDGRGTRVEEHVDGACSKWMAKIVQRECRNAHHGHMLTFGKLFDGDVKAVDAPVS